MVVMGIPYTIVICSYNVATSTKPHTLEKCEAKADNRERNQLEVIMRSSGRTFTEEERLFREI